MLSFYIFIFLSAITNVYSKQEYVPALIWTSREFQGRKNVDYLALKNVKSDLFEAYIMEILGNKKPLIVLFLEQDLNTDDFEWKSVGGDNSFPFLSKLTVNSRVDYFRSVESPYHSITRLKGKGYDLIELKPGTKFETKEGDLLLVEFQKIKDGRPETIKKHDKQIEEIHRRLADSGKSWICIYTARNTHKGFFSDLMKLSPWHVEEQCPEKSTRALSLYQDEFTGFTLITKGSIQLFLPSPKNRAVKNLENYSVASAKPTEDGMDFAIWFSNYSMTFRLKQLKENWIIKEVKLLNDKGDTLKLVPKQTEKLLKNKCYIQLSEFQNEGKPTVKVTVSKYKFLWVQPHEEPCKKPYAFHMTFFFILTTIVSTVICWNKLLESMNFSQKKRPSAKISISTDSFYSNSLLTTPN